MKEKKFVVILSIIIGVLVVTLGVTYSLFTFNRVSKNSSLVVGDIYMNYLESNELRIENAMPSDTYGNNYFEFTISGKNTSNKNIWYEIVLNHGDSHASRSERIKDNLLKFRLVEVVNNVETELFNDKSYDDLTNKRVYVSSISNNTTNEVSITYRLYMLVSNDTKIGNTGDVDYDIDTWNNQVYGSIKVNVTGDFNEKSLGIDLTDKVVSEGFGLYPVNNNGTFASASDEIREYRYTMGNTPADGDISETNYISFNNETWRIVGIFKETTSNGEEQLVKIVKDSALTNLPKTVSGGGITYTFSTDTTKAYFNNPQAGYTGNKNDWTKSGMMYYLNNEYLNSIDSKYLNMIEDVTYHLGNSYWNYTNINSYTEERGTSICASGVNSNNDNTCQVWYNNQATWTGKIALLYASDQIYTRNKSNWSFSSFTSKDEGWFTKSNTFWLLSPGATANTLNTIANSDGTVNDYGEVDSKEYEIYPSLYLKASTIITSGDGTIDNPYVLS